MARVTRHRWSIVGATLAVLLGACGDDESATRPLPTTTTEPIRFGDDAVSTSASPTTTPPTAPPLDADPFAVPVNDDVITEAYVEAVLNELARLDGDALRLITNAGLVTMDAVELIEEVFTPDQVQVQLAELNSLATGAEPLPPSPGDRRYVVTDLLRTSAACVAVATEVDFSAVAPGGPLAQPLTVQLLRKPSIAGVHLNETAWQIAFEFVPGASEGLPLCDG